MREIWEIDVHCTATPPTWREGQSTAGKVAEVRRWHVEDNGWDDIGYHFLIDRDGTIFKGRPLYTKGAHILGRNTGTIGIVLFGGKYSTENDRFEDHFTPEQDRALRKLIAELKDEFPSIKRVAGHNEFAAKACPGFNVPRWYSRKGPKTLMTSGKAAGGTAAAVGTTGTVLADLAGQLQSSAAELSPLLQHADSLKWVFIGLTVLGVGVGLYSTLKDYKTKGRV